MIWLLRRLLFQQRGQAMVEYGITIAIICFGMIAVLFSFSSPVKDLWNYIVTEVTAATP